jgi:hypothetical protein
MATNGTAPTTGDLLTVPSGVARMNYFFGQLLTQRDLHAEQRYHLGLRRLMQREAFGTGTVAGLRVEDAASTAQGSVLVRAGLAMDPDGRELLLLNDQCVSVADAPLTLASPPAAAYTTLVSSSTSTAIDGPTLAGQVSTVWGVAFGANDVLDLWTRLKAAGLTEVNGDTPGTTSSGGPPTGGNYPALTQQLGQLTVPAGFSLAHGQLLRSYLFDALVGTTYLGLQYAERGTDPSPAVLDASCCGNATCFPSRKEEGVIIVAKTTPFPSVADPYEAALRALDKGFLQDETSTGTGSTTSSSAPFAVNCQKHLAEYLLGAWRGLPPTDDPCGPAAPPLVPIARVYWSRFARQPATLSRMLLVDNDSRRLAPGVPPVRALLEALTQCHTTVPTPPTFELISPPNLGVMASGASTMTATATSPLVEGPGTSPVPGTPWEIYFYPAHAAGPGSVTPAYWSSTSVPLASYNFTIAFTTATPPGGVTTVQLQFVPSGGPLSLPSGTYVWRLNVDGAIQAAVTHAPMDGVFEAVFYVA